MSFMLKRQVEGGGKELVDDELEDNNTLIDLGWCEIGNQGVQYLSPRLRPQTTMINLYRNSLTKESLFHIRKASLQQLRYVNLSINLIDNLGCKMITSCQWPQLEELELVRCGIDENGAAHLSKGTWKLLQLLDLSYNVIGNGASKLVQGHWKKLKYLTLSQSKSNMAQLMQLFMGRWKKMAEIDVGVIQETLNNKYKIRWGQKQYAEISKVEELLKHKFTKCERVCIRKQ